MASSSSSIKSESASADLDGIDMAEEVTDAVYYMVTEKYCHVFSDNAVYEDLFIGIEKLLNQLFVPDPEKGSSSE